MRKTLAAIVAALMLAAGLALVAAPALAEAGPGGTTCTGPDGACPTPSTSPAPAYATSCYLPGGIIAPACIGPSGIPCTGVSGLIVPCPTTATVALRHGIIHKHLRHRHAAR
jgi:uncharacterized membrane protein